MPDRSQQEERLQEVAAEAAASSSTNPWGPLGRKLEEDAGTKARAIGIQDNTVIDRAIGSPGMRHALGVHGFVVKEPVEEHRRVPLDKVLARLRVAIEDEPFIKTAVVMPHATDYYPSHILSCDPEVASRLGDAYPNADVEAGLSKQAAELAGEHPGPWLLYCEPQDVDISDTGVEVVLEEDDHIARGLYSSDWVVVARQTDGDPHLLGVGRVHHVVREEPGRHRLIMDRYQKSQGAQEPPENNEQMDA